ncbi:MAG: hypothetical protein BEN18_10335 [Epulopiscium sp. Nuni2H_MBin001]|nr:MAG: hypothetical protein BEN18_10335 [Epulopiscium sp. Nuni2H_MBin001]
MLKSCKYCLRIHDTQINCGYKPARKKVPTVNNKFRSSKAWQNKRDEIRARDKFMCVLCFRQLYDYGAVRYNVCNLEVHHIVPLSENLELGLEDNNLITLCSTHHEMAECGAIPRQLLLDLVSPPVLSNRIEEAAEHHVAP